MAGWIRLWFVCHSTSYFQLIFHRRKQLKIAFSRKFTLALAGFFFYRPKRSFGQGNIFTPVCHSVHRGGGGVPDQVHPPGTRYTPPGPGTPPGTRYNPPPRTRYTPPDQVHPPGTRYTPQARYTPPRAANSGIRSTIGRYASYWNAFLFTLSLGTFIHFFSNFY